LSTQVETPSQITRPAKQPTQLASFIEVVKQYKELILIVIGLVSATLFLRDYFATKSEVGVLRCEMLIQVDMSASQAQLRDINGRILNIQRATIPDDVPPPRRRELEFELRSLEADRQRSQSRLDNAAEQLNSNDCQRQAEG
jgi:hypothetical protein